MRIFVAVPSLGTVSDGHAEALRIITRWPDFIFPQNVAHRRHHDFARNALVDEFLRTGADAIWFLDSDTIPHPGTVDWILGLKDWKLAGCPVPIFRPEAEGQDPQLAFNVYRKKDGQYRFAEPQKGTQIVDGLSAACLFIRRSVFATLKRPFFRFRYDHDSRAHLEGEDFYFMRSVNEHGMHFVVNWDLCCGHVKQVDLLHVNNWAVGMTNAAMRQLASKLA